VQCISTPYFRKCHYEGREARRGRLEQHLVSAPLTRLSNNRAGPRGHAMHRPFRGLEVVKGVIRAELHLIGIAMRAERKVIDKIVDGLKFDSQRVGPINSKRPADARVEGFCKDVGRHDQEG
jgi:hypothetical protein